MRPRRAWEERELRGERSFDARTSPPDDADHDELVEPDAEIVAGRRPVEEAFAARRDARRLIVVPQRRAALEALVLHATTLRIPVVEVEGGTLTSLAGFDGHQGVALVVAARAFATLDDVLARAAERHEPPFVLVLDSLEDPQNFGTLLRTAEAAGVHGVIYPTHHAAPLSPAAVKASAGAVEHLLLVPVDDLPGALTDAHARGLRVVGAEANAPLSFRDADLRGPVALVVGSEGQGVSGAVRRRLDLAVSIPMTGRVASLNAAVAGSVLLVEAALQRGPATGTPMPRALEGAGESAAGETGTDQVGGASATDSSGAAAERTESSSESPDATPNGEPTPSGSARARSSRAGPRTKSSRAAPTAATTRSRARKAAVPQEQDVEPDQQPENGSRSDAVPEVEPRSELLPE